jgi:hypothetical protein
MLSVANLTMKVTALANAAWAYQNKPSDYGAKEMLYKFREVKLFVFDNKKEKNMIVSHVLSSHLIDEKVLIELCESLEVEIKVSELTGKLTIPEFW